MAVARGLAQRIGAGVRTLPNLRFTLTPWTLLTGVSVFLVLLPLLSILVGVFGEPSETWQHLSATVLQDYVVNSFILIVGVGGLTLLMGISSAWLVTACDFPLRRAFEWALVLPLAIPTYIVAYTYAELLAHTGPAQAFLQLFLDPLTTARIRTGLMSVGGVTVMMSLVLYPYVYLITRASFLKQTGGVLETARILGKSPWASFFRVALPMARPGIVAGVTLVLMEVLNEYGAVAYFGVPTFTLGIFRAWFSLGDADAAIRLSACLLLFVFALILIERAQRGRARFDDARGGSGPPSRFALSGIKGWAAFGACAFPVALGFVLPVIQLLAWSFATAPEFLDREFLSLALNSFGLALGAALLTVITALLVVYTVRLHPTPLHRMAERISVLGYSIPGAVIAVGVLIPFIRVDAWVDDFASRFLGFSTGLLITGTVVSLLYAYVVRFLAVALNPVESGFKRLCGNLDEMSRSLGASPSRTLFRVNLPLLKGTLVSAALLVFVDVLKELPLTLILRPFDFDTLATKAFQLASDELVAQSAHPALLIILAGILPVILLNRLMGRSHGREEG